MLKKFKSSIVVALCVVAVSASVFVNPSLAGKGGKGGSGGGSNPPPADVEFRDAAGDTIQSDGAGLYMDGVSGIRATTDSDVGSWSLHLYTPNGTERGVDFDLSMLVAFPDSTPPELIPDGLGEIESALTTPKDLPAPGETINAGIGSISGTFLNPAAPAGISYVTIYFYSSTITAMDATTFVWEIGPTDIVEVNESTKKYRGKKLVTDEFILHGIYTNCSFAIAFTKRP